MINRLIIRLATYIQKIFCYSNSPSNLANCFTLNNDLNKSYNLRNLNIPNFNKYMRFKLGISAKQGLYSITITATTDDTISKIRTFIKSDPYCTYDEISP